MRLLRLIWIAVAVCALWAAIPSSLAQSKGSPSKKSSSKKTITARKTTPKKTTSTRRRSRTRRASWRATQQQPTPERYAEIQRALAEKGYFTGEPDGKWDQQSIDALKRFQEDNKLKADGKLSSLSLIALGLGPKHPPPGEVPRPAGDSPAAEPAQTPEQSAGQPKDRS